MRRLLQQVRQLLPAASRLGTTGLTVRTWILAAMIALTALALATAGFSAATLQSLRVDARIDNDLAASADEFRLLAELGVDPNTGARFDSPKDLVRTAMARSIPARNEGVLGFADGVLAYTTQNPTLSLQNDVELLKALEPLTVREVTTLTTITTATTTYRVIVVPARPPQATPEEDSSDSSVAAFVLAYDRTAEREAFRTVFVTYTGVAIAALGIVTLVGWLIAGKLLQPIRVLAASARRIGREDLSERIPVKGRDDLSDMTRAVNEMLERIDGAFASQRQLLDDVSHELRTPLTVVRGHLELMDSTDPHDANAVRELALGELDRMNRLVDDLMTLATTERPTFVKPAATSIGQLTDDVFDKAIALGDRTWSMAHRAEATVAVDAQRLTQAWLQLAANSVKYSEPGSAVALGSRVKDGEIQLWVEDHGAGVAPDDLERIFDRFAQVSPGERGGAGLGLAIVNAIAQAHGGTVTCESVLGEGSTFTIAVPLEENL